MPFQIEFEKRHIYQSLKPGITLDAILRYGNREQLCATKIDTGSEVCLFARTIADFLEIDVEHGYQETFLTLAGSVVAYAHEIELETLARLYPFFRGRNA